jgi:L-aminopeptidase/D-esterase-like protein
MKYSGAITDVAGIIAGHYTDGEGLTGCTVLLCPDGAKAGVCVNGGAPGTRETDLLKSENTVDTVHAVVLSGGSAFGLAAACGVMQYLKERGVGFDTGWAKVPIVPAAVLFDLTQGSPEAYPDKESGYSACETAGVNIEQGLHGAGRGATVGKAAGNDCSMPGGFGTASIELAGGVIVSACVAVNSVGDIREDGKIIAGANIGGKFINTVEMMFGGANRAGFGQNTTIGAVATNARLSKTQLNRMARVAHNGIARAVYPAHTMMDGDTLFALSMGEMEYDLSSLCEAAAEAVRRSIINAVSGDMK